jgi:hypothetical protein
MLQTSGADGSLTRSGKVERGCSRREKESIDAFFSKTAMFLVCLRAACCVLLALVVSKSLSLASSRSQRSCLSSVRYWVELKVLRLAVCIRKFFRNAAATVLESPFKVLTRSGSVCFWGR